MTNEQKADEICKRHIFDSNHFDCCMEMAEWKDEQIDTIMLTIEACLCSFFESQGNTQESITNFIDALKKQVDENLNKTMKTTNQIDREANERKAREIANDNCTHICLADCSAESYFSSENDCYKAAMAMAQWKDKQFETAINEIKANIIESRDNKEYYETNRKTTLNWILRLIDECCTKGK